MNYKLNEISLDKTQTPVWAEKIKRWSQLDDASFVLAEATQRNLDFFKSDFEQLVIVSTQGSGHTDYLFTTDAKISPSHFVHTLPNVRSIVFSMLTNWEGEMFCLSKGRLSLVNFLKEVSVVHPQTKTMIVSLNKSGDKYHCDFYRIESRDDLKSLDLSGVDDFSFREMLLKKEKL